VPPLYVSQYYILLCNKCIEVFFRFQLAQVYPTSKVLTAIPLMLYHCEHGEVDLMGLKPNHFDPSSFSALTLLVGSFDL